MISIQDAYGNTATGNNTNVTATLNSGSGTLTGTATVAAVNGIASFSNLRIDTAGAKTLHFADGALTAVNSGSFTVSPAAASQLVLSSQPAGATAGAPFTTQPLVTVQDAFGNTVTGDSSSVTATINTGSGTLAGTATIAAVNGIASFSNLRIDTAGAKTLQLTDGALTSCQLRLVHRHRRRRQPARADDPAGRGDRRRRLRDAACTRGAGRVR